MPFNREIATQGGHARAAKLSPERRKEISLLSIQARWRRYRATRAIKACDRLITSVRLMGGPWLMHIGRLEEIKSSFLALESKIASGDVI